MEQWRARERAEDAEISQLMEQLAGELDSEINPLSFEEARQRAAGLLGDSTKFLCIPAAQANEACLDGLAPAIRELFQTYERLAQAHGGMALARRLIEPSIPCPGLVVIGRTGIEHTHRTGIEHTHLAVRLGEEPVYEVNEEREYGPDLPGVRFTTVFHCLIYYDRRETLGL